MTKKIVAAVIGVSAVFGVFGATSASAKKPAPTPVVTTTTSTDTTTTTTTTLGLCRSVVVNGVLIEGDCGPEGEN